MFSRHRHHRQASIVLLIFLVTYFGLVQLNPYPLQLNSIEARFEYGKQLFLVLIGLQSSWNTEVLQSVYSKTSSLSPNDHFVINSGAKSTQFLLSPLPEVSTNDSSWRLTFEKHFIQQNSPIVVRGLLYDRRYINISDSKTWNINRILGNLGKTRIPVFTHTKVDKSVRFQPFNEYVDGLQNKSRFHYARCIDSSALDAEFPDKTLVELMRTQFPHFLTNVVNGGKGSQCLFIGSSHLTTGLHCDVTISAFLMLQGRKRWTLFPPSESLYFLPTPHESNVAYNAFMDVFDEKSFEKYPFISRARGKFDPDPRKECKLITKTNEGWEVIIEPGDILFFPAMTWHSVENLDEITVGMDYALIDPVSSLKTNPLLAIGTMFNPNSVRMILNMIYEGKSAAKEVFFKGYYADAT